MCGVILVDAESFWSSCHRRDAYIHDHCLRYHPNFALFYQLLNSKFFTHRMLSSGEKPLVKPMPPRSILHHFSFPSTCQFLSPFHYFAIFYFPSHKPKIPKILLYHLSISIRSHFANNREGIDNPFIALGASLLIVCAGIR